MTERLCASPSFSSSFFFFLSFCVRSPVCETEWHRRFLHLHPSKNKLPLAAPSWHPSSSPSLAPPPQPPPRACCDRLPVSLWVKELRSSLGSHTTATISSFKTSPHPTPIATAWKKDLCLFPFYLTKELLVLPSRSHLHFPRAPLLLVSTAVCLACQQRRWGSFGVGETWSSSAAAAWTAKQSWGKKMRERYFLPTSSRRRHWLDDY